MNALLALLLAVPPPAQDPRFYVCTARRDAPYGEISLYQYITREGRALGTPAAAWTAQLPSGGPSIYAVWGVGRPIEEAGHGFISFTASPPDATAGYRLQIWRSTADMIGDMQFGGPMKQGGGELGLSWMAQWSLVIAVARGAGDLQIVLLRADDEVVRADRIPPETFARVLALAPRLRPTLNAALADYRQRCEPSQDDGMPDQVPG